MIGKEEIKELVQFIGGALWEGIVLGVNILAGYIVSCYFTGHVPSSQYMSQVVDVIFEASIYNLIGSFTITIFLAIGIFIIYPIVKIICPCTREKIPKDVPKNEEKRKEETYTLIV